MEKDPSPSRFARHLPQRGRQGRYFPLGGKWREAPIGGFWKETVFISHSFFLPAKERMGDERKRHPGTLRFDGGLPKGGRRGSRRRWRMKRPAVFRSGRKMRGSAKARRIFRVTARWKVRPLASQRPLPGINRHGGRPQGSPLRTRRNEVRIYLQGAFPFGGRMQGTLLQAKAARVSRKAACCAMGPFFSGSQYANGDAASAASPLTVKPVFSPP